MKLFRLVITLVIINPDESFENSQSIVVNVSYVRCMELTVLCVLLYEI